MEKSCGSAVHTRGRYHKVKKSNTMVKLISRIRMSSSSSKRDKRIQEMSKLIKKDFQVKLTDEDKLDQLEVVFHGPKESLYEDGVWKIIVDFLPKYPSKSPSFTFANKIFHPNITECSYVCVNVLDEDWDPSYGLVAIFDQIIPQLLREPNPEDPNNHEAAALLRDESKEKVRTELENIVQSMQRWKTYNLKARQAMKEADQVKIKLLDMLILEKAFGDLSF